MFEGDLPLGNVNIINSKSEVDKIIEKHSLNKSLLKERNISDESIIVMDYYYTKINYLFELAKQLENVKKHMSNKQYKREAKKIGKEVDKCEKQLQKLWKFEKDSNYYTFWINIPGCICPKLDNLDARGFTRIINCNCSYHSFLINK